MPIVTKDHCVVYFSLQVVYYMFSTIWNVLKKGKYEFDSLLHHLFVICVMAYCVFHQESINLVEMQMIAYGCIMVHFITGVLLTAKATKHIGIYAFGMLLWVIFRLICHPFILFYYPFVSERLFSFHIGIILLSIYFFFTVNFKVLGPRRNEDTRKLILKSLGFLWNVPVAFIEDNPDLAQKVLKSSTDKGDFLEQIIVANAWKPILPLESANGTNWVRMKKMYQQINASLDSTDCLKDIVNGLVESSKDQEKFIDAIEITKIVAKAMCKWIFGFDITEENAELFCQASFEWRKEIALKGKKDQRITDKTITLFLSLIQRSPLWSIYEEDWSKPEVYSVLLQPFLIGPMINISDIAVSMHRLYREHSKTNTLPFLVCEKIDEAIHGMHPFPVLERILTEDVGDSSKGAQLPQGTHVFIFLDTMGKKIPYNSETRWTPFSVGQRGCIGKHIAMALMVPLFGGLIDYPHFNPEKNHRFSGRNNDENVTVSETLYQLTTLFRIAWTGYLVHTAKNRVK
jgi:hypothetical protein